MQENRKLKSGLHKQFVQRWSSRKFDGTRLSENEVELLMEAARWAPSSFNAQPWLFIIPEQRWDDSEEWNKAFFILNEWNRNWAKDAGFLSFIAAKRNFSAEHNGQKNLNYAFDTGAAWLSLALQANYMGLSAHAMAGIDIEEAYRVFQIDKTEYEILAALAVGKPIATVLPDENFLNHIEERSGRSPISKIIKRV